MGINKMLKKLESISEVVELYTGADLTATSTRESSKIMKLRRSDVMKLK
jgi:hypothetical protein